MFKGKILAGELELNYKTNIYRTFIRTLFKTKIYLNISNPIYHEISKNEKFGNFNLGLRG